MNKRVDLSCEHLRPCERRCPFFGLALEASTRTADAPPARRLLRPFGFQFGRISTNPFANTMLLGTVVGEERRSWISYSLNPVYGAKMLSLLVIERYLVCRRRTIRCGTEQRAPNHNSFEKSDLQSLGEERSRGTEEVRATAACGPGSSVDTRAEETDRRLRHRPLRVGHQG